MSSGAAAAVLLYMADESELVVFSARLAAYGLQVVPVGSLDEARRALGEHAIACAFAEVRSTEPAGLAVIRNVLSICPQVPVVVLSSDHDLPSRIEGRDAGAEHYLATPIRHIDLDMCVAQLRRRMPIAESKAGAGALEALPLPEPGAPAAGLVPLPEPGAQLVLENRELHEKLLELGAQLRDAERREQEARANADDLRRRLSDHEQEAQRAQAAPVEHTSGPSRPAPSIGGRPPPEVDPLTGLLGAGRLQDHLDREYARARRYGHALCVLMLDVDRLARYHKAHGKAAGDRALCLVADVLRAALRTPDVAARVGGDEFVIVATDTTEEQALQLAERLRSALREEGQHAVQPPVTVSIGIASCGRPEVKRAEDLLRSARTAVKQAKSAGRDRASLAGP